MVVCTSQQIEFVLLKNISSKSNRMQRKTYISPLLAYLNAEPQAIATLHSQMRFVSMMRWKRDEMLHLAIAASLRQEFVPFSI